MIIFISTKEDTEASLMRFQCATAESIHLFWEDYSIKWSFMFSGNVLGLAFSTREYQQLEAEDIIFCRYPSLEVSADATCKQMKEAYDILQLCFSDFLVGNPNVYSQIGNKLTQLKYFGGLAPMTQITNCAHKLRGHKIVKSLGPNRSKVCELKSLALTNQNKRISIPALLQEKCEGEDFKIHFSFVGDEPQVFGLKIESTETDFRYAKDSLATYRELAEIPATLLDLAKQIHQETGCRSFDIDGRFSEGSIKILEWNDSPCVASYWNATAASGSAYMKSLFTKEIPVILSSRDDQTSIYLTDQFPSKCVHLYYEDFGSTWRYELYNGRIFFRLRDISIYPHGIYDRGVSVRNSSRALQDFVDSLDTAHCPVICAPSRHWRNGSKMAQSISTIKNALKNTNGEIRVPRSKIIKKTRNSTGGLSLFPESIVKSLSGHRSIVVDQNDFKDWDQSSLQNLPTLFQEKLDGANLRVHCFKEQSWASQVYKQDRIDYRYSNTQISTKIVPISKKVQEFCTKCGQVEGNSLIGVDLIHSGDSFYCLEVNPGPGWAYFQALDEDKNSSLHQLSQNLFQHLQGGQ